MRKILIDFVPGLVGSLVGGFLGYFLVEWLRRQGFYTIVLPGALAGLGCGLFSVTSSRVRGILCALEAAAFGLISEWLIMYGPKEKTLDNFLGFLAQFKNEPLITPLMLALGVFLGYWWGREATFPWRHRFASFESKPSSRAGLRVNDE
jgi:hypothetical protein